MRYRQWKKNYKKQHGINPPDSIDKRKRYKQQVRAIKALASVDISKLASRVSETITDAMARFMRALGNGLDGAGTTCKEIADNIQPLEIESCGLDWEVKPVVCDYGVYENCKWNGSSELKLITNSHSAAKKIVEIMQQDQLQHYKANYPEMVKAVKASKDGYRAETVIYDELLHQWTDKECSE